MGDIKRQVFYSFYYKDDVMRVQQIRNMGVIEGNPPVSANQWEEVRKKGETAVKKWIDENMTYRSCVIVLVGKETATRPYVKYEIQKAWESGKGLFGIYIHNLECPNNGKCNQGDNPFDQFTFRQNGKVKTIKCYNPKSTDAYNDIKNNIENWIEEAIKSRKN